MLISSIVWSCSITGKPNLTYAEALESEKQARRLLRTFPAAVKGPFLMVASKTKRSSFNEMLEDVFGFIKDHFFEQEIVDAMEPSGRKYREATIVEVIAPKYVLLSFLYLKLFHLTNCFFQHQVQPREGGKNPLPSAVRRR